jgi:hypothetical protein
MYEIVFNSKLKDEDSLYCPKEFSFKEAEYKVIVTMPDKDASDNDIETSAVVDNSEEYLTQDEINYYMNLV